jgi:hypothetical protein
MAAPTSEDIAAFRAELEAFVGSAAAMRVLIGVQRPRNYTGNAMQTFACARQVLQQPGEVMPNACLVPMNKTAAWWEVVAGPTHVLPARLRRRGRHGE